eukprot:496981-Amphidinium_carterae.1
MLVGSATGVTSALWYGSTVLVVFGGESLPGSTKKSSLNDLWLYSPHEGGGWIKLTDSHCSADYTGLYSLEDLGFRAKWHVSPVGITFADSLLCNLNIS